MTAKIIINHHGADRVLAGHPWVFKSDILETDQATPGDVVEVLLGKNRCLGLAFYNPRSQISLRVISRSREPIDEDFWRKKLETSILRREQKRIAQRLVFGESDQIPGLILDRYRDILVFQTLSLGIDRLKESLLELFEELFHPAAIVERNDPAVRDLEGLPRQRGIVRGGLPQFLEVTAGGKIFYVDPIDGQKTGLYLDQADNRTAARRYASGRILDLFCYQANFAVQLADRAEEVIGIDSSGPALQIGRQNLERNGIGNVTLLEANVFDTLHSLQNRGEKFDMILLDPPPFVGGREKLAGGMRGYKEINLRAMKLLKPEGILITSSCSQNFSETLFYEMLLAAASDTHRSLQILERRGAAPDHPVLLTFPESSYLQCWILRVL